MENNIPLPKIKNNWVKGVMMQVTSGNGTLRQVDAELVLSKNLMEPFIPIDRTALDNVMMKAATQYASNFSVNITTHFRKRVKKYVFWTFSPKDGTRIEGTQNLQIKSM